MIRINLLGTPKTKVRRMPKVTMSAPSVRMLSILTIVIAFGAVGFLYWRAQNQHEKTGRASRCRQATGGTGRRQGGVHTKTKGERCAQT